ncbi:MAG: RsfS/YbeB/iojap family protein [Bacteroidales bacterium]
MDYFDVVVHIFLEHVRGFYKIEELWADGIITRTEEK